MLHHKVVQNVRTSGFILSWSTALHVSELYSGAGNGAEYPFLAIGFHGLFALCRALQRHGAATLGSWRCQSLVAESLICQDQSSRGMQWKQHSLPPVESVGKDVGRLSVLHVILGFSRHVSLLVYHVYMQEYMRACVHMYMFDYVCMYVSRFKTHHFQRILWNLCQVGPWWPQCPNVMSLQHWKGWKHCES